jgi:hypothetical protein
MRGGEDWMEGREREKQKTRFVALLLLLLKVEIENSVVRNSELG